MLCHNSCMMSRPINESPSDKRHFLFTVAENANETGILSVEEYLSTLSTPSHIEKLKADLVYPAPVGRSLLPTVFDEFSTVLHCFKNSIT